MFENNVISLKYCLTFMFFYNEYSNNIVDLHLNEKIKFYRFKYFSSLKPIVLLLKYVRIKYKAFNETFNKKLFITTKLLFYSYFNIPIKYINNSKKDHSCYSLVILNELVYKYNTFYFFFLSFLKDSFKDLLFVDISKKKKIYRTIKLNFEDFSFSPTHKMFINITSFNSFVNFFFKSNTNNVFLNKLFFSHTLFNI